MSVYDQCHIPAHQHHINFFHFFFAHPDTVTYPDNETYPHIHIQNPRKSFGVKHQVEMCNLKIRHGNRVILVRGNHETLGCAMSYELPADLLLFCQEHCKFPFGASVYLMILIARVSYQKLFVLISQFYKSQKTTVPAGFVPAQECQFQQVFDKMLVPAGFVLMSISTVRLV